MFIQTEVTPNPATLKFLPGRDVYPGGSAEFKSVQDCAASPLAKRIFGIDGVAGVFLGRDFISISKTEALDWNALKPRILAALMEHFSTGQPVMAQAPDSAATAQDEDDDEIVMQIKELIATRVRPAVAMDGGDIVFDRFEDGVVYLEMRGACAGCPSSTMTLKSGIENMLRHFIPEVREVRPVQDY